MRLARFVPYVLLTLLLVTVAACAALPPTRGAGESATAAPTETQPAAAAPTETATTQPAEAAATETATAEPTDATVAPTNVLALCPAAGDDMQQLINFEHRYCLTYPAKYKVEKPNESETLLLVGGLLDAEHARVHINVVPAEGRTAESAADQLVAENEGFELVRSEAMVAGQPAVVLDNVPGQDINRRVFFVQDDRLFTLYFSPADPAVEAFADMESLYQDILSSFTFIPADAELPTDRAMMDCLDETTGTQALVDKDLAFCLLYPADYESAKPNPNEIVLYAGSLMDVTRPKVFIQVADAAGRTATQVADAIAAESGEGVERTFGVTIGYEVAERLDNVPGQDLSRQVIAVRSDRVYTLVFVPDDETQGDVYGQMEELYDLVLRSFRFLN